MSSPHDAGAKSPLERTHTGEAIATDNKSTTTISPSYSNKSSPPADIDELDEEATLQHLSATARDQDDLERDISHQANLAIIEAEDRKDENRIHKAQSTKTKFLGQKKTQEQKYRRALGNQTLRNTIQAEIARIDAEVNILDQDIIEYERRIEERHQTRPETQDAAAANTAATGRLPGETKREFLIRTGKITPFAKIGGPRSEEVVGELANAIVDAEDEAEEAALEEQGGTEQVRSHQNLRLPGFAEEEKHTSVSTAAAQGEFSLRPRKKRKLAGKEMVSHHSDDDFDPDSAPSPLDEDEADYDMTNVPESSKRKKTKTTKAVNGTGDKIDFSQIDDGDEASYQRRLTDWVERRSRARRNRQEREGVAVDEGDDEEWFKPSPDQPDQQLEGGLKIPGDIFPSLFDYQKTGVQWLAELYEQQVGGIVGDEMGLGKTIQVIAFVAALHHSKKLTKPVLIVAPATVLQQWVSEFHRWWPALRVSILHSSGSGMLNVRDEDEGLDQGRPQFKKSGPTARKVVNRVLEHGHVLVTTYAGIQTYRDVLIPVDWELAVLDEGHKIRNPHTTVTINCKELLTANRIILSGTPMQNNLVELWSIFDFINPMHLGSLVAFRQQFEVPIKIGGYGNATKVQMMTAQKCAETLKDAISPYLLQRTKKDVAADLPKKREQVLFCKLTEMQRSQYEYFIRSSEMTAIMNKTRLPLAAISYLRKICNHPELARPQLKETIGYQPGSSEYSGKMQVVKSLVKMWKRLGHKALLFSQGVKMLDILQGFLARNDFNFLRMDGSTPIKERQRLVDQFNNDPDIDIFLLTTKVGGLGVNLTGASRVIIYDPDWNPSTDVQARERAWRLGQKKEVAIYRLMTAGTIEEKIYQRQIWKQFLANKVLNDPKQRTNLNVSDLHDLFTLSTDHSGGTETSQLFGGSEVKMTVTPKPKITPGIGLYDLGGQRAAEGMMAAPKKTEDEDDLKEIKGVASLEDFKDDVNGGEDENAEQEEDRIMAGIYAKGVDQSLDHDEIVGGRRVARVVPAVLRAEAARVAQEGAEHLRVSREQARNVAIGTPTWTGQVGTAGRNRPNANRPRGTVGSGGVLSGVRSRQGLDSGDGDSSRSSTPLPPGRRTAYGMEDFKKMIALFLQRNGGKAPSKMIVDHFNPRVGTDQKMVAAFKAALDRVAVLEEHSTLNRGAMRKNWVLKREFRDVPPAGTR